MHVLHDRPGLGGPGPGHDDLLDRLGLLDVTKPNGLIVVSRRAGGQKPYAHTPVPGATA